jgi:hypothetical protein
LHSGQSDRVRLGTPVAIATLSQLLGSGLGAQDGCGSLPCGKIELMFLAKDHAAFDNDLVKLAGWADIGRHLLCGFGERRNSENCDSMGNPAEKWLTYSNPNSSVFGVNRAFHEELRASRLAGALSMLAVPEIRHTTGTQGCPKA